MKSNFLLVPTPGQRAKFPVVAVAGAAQQSVMRPKTER